MHRNLIANYLGQGWVALMGLAFIPVYINFLGIEAYGLIAIFAMLQVWLGILDFGMTPALAREMSRFQGGQHSAQSIRDLLRTIEILVVLIAVLVVFLVALSANWLAENWVNAADLTVGEVSQAFSLMGVVIALRFIESIYRSCLLGLQQQVLFNIINSALATLRSVGALGVLSVISPTIDAFFIWQGLVSGFTVLALGVAVYNNLPHSRIAPTFSAEAIRDIWKFSSGMLGITLLSLLLAQLDKVVLSKYLPLSDFSYYSIAATAAGILPLIAAPVTQAFYPRLCALCASGDEAGFADIFHSGTQLIVIFCGSVTITTFFFSDIILFAWTKNSEVSDMSASLLGLLVFGNFLSALVHLPYLAQLAHGWVSLTIRLHTVAVVISIPALYIAVPLYAAEGAAVIWILINFAYVLFGVQFMFSRILTAHRWIWYFEDIIVPLMAGFIVMLVIYELILLTFDGAYPGILMVFLSYLVCLISMCVASFRCRKFFIKIVHRNFDKGFQ